MNAPPYFVVINRALRDEGTSYHYMRPSEYSDVDPQLAKLTQEAFATAGVSVTEGATGTTDARFRETQEAIDAALRA